MLVQLAQQEVDKLGAAVKEGRHATPENLEALPVME